MRSVLLFLRQLQPTTAHTRLVVHLPTPGKMVLAAKVAILCVVLSLVLFPAVHTRGVGHEAKRLPVAADPTSAKAAFSSFVRHFWVAKEKYLYSQYPSSGKLFVLFRISFFLKR